MGWPVQLRTYLMKSDVHIEIRSNLNLECFFKDKKYSDE